MDLGRHPYETLEAEALHLPREDRSKLATRLIESLDEDDDLELSPEWNSETQRRLREIDSGAVTLIPHDEVMAKVQQRLAKIDSGEAKMIPSEEIWKRINQRFGTRF